LYQRLTGHKMPLLFPKISGRQGGFMAATNNITRIVQRVFILLLIFASSAGWARYEIHNASNSTLKFDTLDAVRGTWKTWNIFPNQTREFQWESGVKSGKVRIATENRGFVEYDVHAGKRYSFVWDQRKSVWDMRTVGGLANAPQQVAAPVKATWALENRTNEKLVFQTREPKDANWREQSAFPNEHKSFHFSPGVTQGRIRIATKDRGYVEYDIRAGWRYSIIWDKNKAVWDFRTERRGPA
jgi:hypothetical protein